jgi:hypothetical protein
VRGRRGLTRNRLRTAIKGVPDMWAKSRKENEYEIVVMPSPWTNGRSVMVSARWSAQDGRNKPITGTATSKEKVTKESESDARRMTTSAIESVREGEGGGGGTHSRASGQGSEQTKVNIWLPARASWRVTRDGD